MDAVKKKCVKKKNGHGLPGNQDVRLSKKSSGSTLMYMDMNKGQTYSVSDPNSVQNKPSKSKRGQKNGTAQTPKMYECNMCNKRFQKEKSLSRHAVIHSDKNPFACSTCSRNFKTRSDLVRHERIHTGETPWHCTTCGKKFNQVSHLKSHSITHNQPLHFACSLCDRKFNFKVALKRHMYCHTPNSSPYVCQICGKDCKQTSHLKEHLRTHTGEKPFYCKECDLGFNCKGNMHKHFRRYHPGETIQSEKKPGRQKPISRTSRNKRFYETFCSGSEKNSTAGPERSLSESETSQEETALSTPEVTKEQSLKAAREQPEGKETAESKKEIKTHTKGCQTCITEPRPNARLEKGGKPVLKRKDGGRGRLSVKQKNEADDIGSSGASLLCLPADTGLTASEKQAGKQKKPSVKKFTSGEKRKTYNQPNKIAICAEPTKRTGVETLANLVVAKIKQIVRPLPKENVVSSQKKMMPQQPNKFSQVSKRQDAILLKQSNQVKKNVTNQTLAASEQKQPSIQEEDALLEQDGAASDNEITCEQEEALLKETESDRIQEKGDQTITLNPKQNVSILKKILNQPVANPGLKAQSSAKEDESSSCLGPNHVPHREVPKQRGYLLKESESLLQETESLLSSIRSLCDDMNLTQCHIGIPSNPTESPNKKSESSSLAHTGSLLVQTETLFEQSALFDSPLEQCSLSGIGENQLSNEEPSSVPDGSFLALIEPPPVVDAHSVHLDQSRFQQNLFSSAGPQSVQSHCKLPSISILLTPAPCSEGSTAHPELTVSHPELTVSHPVLSTAHPELTVSHLEVSTAHPELTVSHPKLTVSHPELTVSHPEVSTAHPELTVSHPKPTVSHPVLSTVHTEVTVSHPELTVSHPKLAVSHPVLSTAHPELTVLHPELTVSHPHLIVSHPGLSLSHSENPELPATYSGQTTALSLGQMRKLLLAPGLHHRQHSSVEKETSELAKLSKDKDGHCAQGDQGSVKNAQVPKYLGEKADEIVMNEMPVPSNESDIVSSEILLIQTDEDSHLTPLEATVAVSGTAEHIQHVWPEQPQECQPQELQADKLPVQQTFDQGLLQVPQKSVEMPSKSEESTNKPVVTFTGHSSEESVALTHKPQNTLINQLFFNPEPQQNMQDDDTHSLPTSPPPETVVLHGKLTQDSITATEETSKASRSLYQPKQQPALTQRSSESLKQQLDITVKDTGQPSSVMVPTPIELPAASDGMLRNTPTAHPELTVSHPELTVSHPELSTALPELSVSHPEVSTAHPELTVLHPELTVSHPERSVSHPVLLTAHPELSVSHPEVSTAHPELTVSHPKPTVSHPVLSTVHTELTVSLPEVSTENPQLTVSHPELSFSHSENPELSASHSGQTTALSLGQFEHTEIQSSQTQLLTCLVQDSKQTTKPKVKDKILAEVLLTSEQGLLVEGDQRPHQSESSQAVTQVQTTADLPQNSTELRTPAQNPEHTYSQMGKLLLAPGLHHGQHSSVEEETSKLTELSKDKDSHCAQGDQGSVKNAQIPKYLGEKADEIVVNEMPVPSNESDTVSSEILLIQTDEDSHLTPLEASVAVSGTAKHIQHVLPEQPQECQPQELQADKLPVQQTFDQGLLQVPQKSVVMPSKSEESTNKPVVTFTGHSSEESVALTHKPQNTLINQLFFNPESPQNMQDNDTHSLPTSPPSETVILHGKLTPDSITATEETSKASRSLYQPKQQPALTQRSSESLKQQLDITVKDTGQPSSVMVPTPTELPAATDGMLRNTPLVQQFSQHAEDQIEIHQESTSVAISSEEKKEKTSDDQRQVQEPLQICSVLEQRSAELLQEPALRSSTELQLSIVEVCGTSEEMQQNSELQVTWLHKGEDKLLEDSPKLLISEIETTGQGTKKATEEQTREVLSTKKHSERTELPTEEPSEIVESKETPGDLTSSGEVVGTDSSQTSSPSLTVTPESCTVFELNSSEGSLHTMKTEFKADRQSEIVTEVGSYRSEVTYTVSSESSELTPLGSQQLLGNVTTTEAESPSSSPVTLDTYCDEVTESENEGPEDESQMTPHNQETQHGMVLSCTETTNQPSALVHSVELSQDFEVGCDHQKHNTEQSGVDKEVKESESLIFPGSDEDPSQTESTKNLSIINDDVQEEVLTLGDGLNALQHDGSTVAETELKLSAPQEPQGVPKESENCDDNQNTENLSVKMLQGRSSLVVKEVTEKDVVTSVDLDVTCNNQGAAVQSHRCLTEGSDEMFEKCLTGEDSQTQSTSETDDNDQRVCINISPNFAGTSDNFTPEIEQTTCSVNTYSVPGMCAAQGCVPAEESPILSSISDELTSVLTMITEFHISDQYQRSVPLSVIPVELPSANNKFEIHQSSSQHSEDLITGTNSEETAGCLQNISSPPLDLLHDHSVSSDDKSFLTSNYEHTEASTPEAFVKVHIHQPDNGVKERKETDLNVSSSFPVVVYPESEQDHYKEKESVESCSLEQNATIAESCADEFEQNCIIPSICTNALDMLHVSKDHLDLGAGALMNDEERADLSSHNEASRDFQLQKSPSYSCTAETCALASASVADEEHKDPTQSSTQHIDTRSQESLSEDNKSEVEHCCTNLDSPSRPESSNEPVDSPSRPESSNEPVENLRLSSVNQSGVNEQDATGTNLILSAEGTMIGQTSEENVSSVKEFSDPSLPVVVASKHQSENCDELERDQIPKSIREETMGQCDSQKPTDTRNDDFTQSSVDSLASVTDVGEACRQSNDSHDDVEKISDTDLPKYPEKLSSESLSEKPDVDDFGGNPTVSSMDVTEQSNMRDKIHLPSSGYACVSDECSENCSLGTDQLIMSVKNQEDEETLSTSLNMVTECTECVQSYITEEDQSVSNDETLTQSPCPLSPHVETTLSGRENEFHLAETRTEPSEETEAETHSPDTGKTLVDSVAQKSPDGSSDSPADAVLHDEITGPQQYGETSADAIVDDPVCQKLHNVFSEKEAELLPTKCHEIVNEHQKSALDSVEPSGVVVKQEPFFDDSCKEIFSNTAVKQKAAMLQKKSRKRKRLSKGKKKSHKCRKLMNHHSRKYSKQPTLLQEQENVLAVKSEIKTESIQENLEPGAVAVAKAFMRTKTQEMKPNLEGVLLQSRKQHTLMDEEISVKQENTAVGNELIEIEIKQEPQFDVGHLPTYTGPARTGEINVNETQVKQELDQEVTVQSEMKELAHRVRKMIRNRFHKHFKKLKLFERPDFQRVKSEIKTESLDPTVIAKDKHFSSQRPLEMSSNNPGNSSSRHEHKVAAEDMSVSQGNVSLEFEAMKVDIKKEPSFSESSLLSCPGSEGIHQLTKWQNKLTKKRKFPTKSEMMQKSRKRRKLMRHHSCRHVKTSNDCAEGTDILEVKPQIKAENSNENTEPVVPASSPAVETLVDKIKRSPSNQQTYFQDTEEEALFCKNTKSPENSVTSIVSIKQPCFDSTNLVIKQEPFVDEDNIGVQNIMAAEVCIKHENAIATCSPLPSTHVSVKMSPLHESESSLYAVKQEPDSPCSLCRDDNSLDSIKESPKSTCSSAVTGEMTPWYSGSSSSSPEFSCSCESASNSELSPCPNESSPTFKTSYLRKMSNDIKTESVQKMSTVFSPSHMKLSPFSCDSLCEPSPCSSDTCSCSVGSPCSSFGEPLHISSPCIKTSPCDGDISSQCETSLCTHSTDLQQISSFSSCSQKPSGDPDRTLLWSKQIKNSPCTNHEVSCFKGSEECSSLISQNDIKTSPSFHSENSSSSCECNITGSNQLSAQGFKSSSCEYYDTRKQVLTSPYCRTNVSPQNSNTEQARTTLPPNYMKNSPYFDESCICSGISPYYNKDAPDSIKMSPDSFPSSKNLMETSNCIPQTHGFIETASSFFGNPSDCFNIPLYSSDLKRYLDTELAQKKNALISNDHETRKNKRTPQSRKEDMSRHQQECESLLSESPKRSPSPCSEQVATETSCHKAGHQMSSPTLSQIPGHIASPSRQHESFEDEIEHHNEPSPCLSFHKPPLPSSSSSSHTDSAHSHGKAGDENSQCQMDFSGTQNHISLTSSVPAETVANLGLDFASPTSAVALTYAPPSDHTEVDAEDVLPSLVSEAEEQLTIVHSESYSNSAKSIVFKNDAQTRRPRKQSVNNMKIRKCSQCDTFFTVTINKVGQQAHKTCKQCRHLRHRKTLNLVENPRGDLENTVSNSPKSSYDTSLEKRKHRHKKACRHGNKIQNSKKITPLLDTGAGFSSEYSQSYSRSQHQKSQGKADGRQRKMCESHSKLSVNTSIVGGCGKGGNLQKLPEKTAEAGNHGNWQTCSSKEPLATECKQTSPEKFSGKSSVPNTQAHSNKSPVISPGNISHGNHQEKHKQKSDNSAVDCSHNLSHSAGLKCDTCKKAFSLMSPFLSNVKFQGQTLESYQKRNVSQNEHSHKRSKPEDNNTNKRNSRYPLRHRKP